MAQRVLSGYISSGANINHPNGGSFSFYISSDNGPDTSANAGLSTITSASMYMSSIQTYAAGFTVNISGLGYLSFGEAANNSTHSADKTIYSPPIGWVTSYISGLSCSVSGSGSGNKINVRDYCSISVTINYTLPTACRAPTSVSVNNSTPAPGASVTLSWSGAAAGTGTLISGYYIYRSINGGGASHFTTVSTSATSGSTTVAASSTAGERYTYTVLTVANISSLNSGVSSASATITATRGASTAPTSVIASTSRPQPGTTITISWSGATAGVNNAISGFEIYRSTSATGTYTLLGSISTTGSSGSFNTSASSTIGQSFYYKIKTISAYPGFDSALSGEYAVATATLYENSPPTSITASLNSLWVGDSFTLSWSGAAPGIDEIVGYRIFKGTSATGSYEQIAEVAANTTFGSLYIESVTLGTAYYKVLTLGIQESYHSVLSTAYASVATKARPSTAEIGIVGSTNARH